MPLPIEKTIVELSSCDTLLSSRLAKLSHLSAAEMMVFMGAWGDIATKRRREIIDRLVEMAEDNVELNFDCIFKYCLKDQDDEVRSQAIEGLWENEEASLVSPLITLLEQDASEQVQAAAAKALGKYTMLAEHRKLRSCHVSRLGESLLAVINDTNRPLEVRRRALEAVAPLGLPAVKAAIMAAYQSGDAMLRISSIYAMGRNCAADWLPILLKELDSDDAEVRFEAAGACGELEEEGAVPCLIKLVNDQDADVQMAAIQALGKIGGTKARECLEHCLSGSGQAIRHIAGEALRELAAKAALSSFGL
ncbi:MAG: HEAT repeat domain-containing protein [Chloroflexi bacterium]|nr:HEAT repeat domain-containing protein [Chloroflexota bacterium]